MQRLWQRIVNGSLALYRAGYNLVYNDGIEMAGYLTFLTLLALFPFLVLIVAAFGFIGQGAMGIQFVDFLADHLPEDAIVALMPRIEEITSGPPQGLLTVAILAAIWTSSSAVEGMRTVLNRAYKVSEPPHYFFRRLVSIAQIIVFTFLIIFIMIVLVLAPLAITGFMQMTETVVPLIIEQLFIDYFVYIAAFVLFAGIAGLYYVLPNLKQSFIGVAPGAALVVVLWIGGSSAIAYYLDHISNVNVIYGSLSSLIATLIFFFVMNIIFIYGAEVNHVLLEALGKRIVEKEKSDISPDDKVIKNPHTH
jgi:membrane protein